MGKETRRRTPVTLSPACTPSGVKLSLGENRFGSLELQMHSVHLSDGKGVVTVEIASGAALEVQINYIARHLIDAPMFGVTINNADEHECCEFISRESGFDLAKVNGEGSVTLRIERLDLTPGRYYIDVGVYETNWAYAYDYHWRAYELTVTGSTKGKGIMSPPHLWYTTRSTVLPEFSAD